MATGEPKWWYDMINTKKEINNLAIEYVCGFLFNKEETKVVLIKKNRPLWQNGLLNGVGGKIELGETPLEAMTREFFEETGLEISTWQFITQMSNENNKISFFKAYSDDINNVKTMTDELIQVIEISDLPEKKTLPNLHWLIPMILDQSVLSGQIYIR